MKVECMKVCLSRDTFVVSGGITFQWAREYRGTSLIRNSAPLGPCSRTVPRALRLS